MSTSYRGLYSCYLVCWKGEAYVGKEEGNIPSYCRYHYSRLSLVRKRPVLMDWPQPQD